ncbi:Hypothetical protein PSEBR_m1580 [Pseudomonas brassicacearum subsp. brassicacearum NFM421]|uniref:Uncharacterized protein n=1 Tax=Pseudomonas brassicacearum (strain NFM421) TaxID=994484 RepID=F2KLV0_PSEBN|nr:Hypothetical protein PSEBR_m1580 [Pseudomonas brassicacearum subsp. brassicacearum NFM421]
MGARLARDAGAAVFQKSRRLFAGKPCSHINPLATGGCVCCWPSCNLRDAYHGSCRMKQARCYQLRTIRPLG